MKRVGIIGGGQLARMLALTGRSWGLDFLVLDPDRECPVSVAARMLPGEVDDPGALADLARDCDVLTYESENMSVPALRSAAVGPRLAPPLKALEVAQDRWLEKRLLGQLGIPTTACALIETPEDLAAAAAEVGFPAYLKSCRAGYDGRGQVRVEDRQALQGAWHGWEQTRSVLEREVAYRREVSMIAVRGRDGDTRFYPLVENIHRRGMLHRSTPRPEDDAGGPARDYALRLLDAFDYVGVMTLELFDTRDGLLANEIAPRVHNSGHWTLDAARTSQFANHLRAILALPLGDTRALEHCTMFNLVGALPPLERLLTVPEAYVHYYDKQPRPARKLGHVTLRSPDSSALGRAADRLEALLV